MKQVLILVVIASGITLTAFGSDNWQRQQERQCQKATINMPYYQRIGAVTLVSFDTIINFDPYTRKAQQYQNVAAQQETSTLDATDKNRKFLNYECNY